MRRSLVILLVLIPFLSGAQLQGQKRIDSLLLEVRKDMPDTIRIKLLDDLSKGFHSFDPNEGIKYGLMQLEAATRLGFTGEIIKAYTSLGINYMYKSNYPTSLQYFNKALSLFAEPMKPGLYADVVSHLGVISQEMGNYDKALEYGLISLSLDTTTRDTSSIAGDLGNIGIIYMIRGDYEKALEYDFRSLELFRQLGDTDGIAHNLGNIGNVYKEYANYVQALEYDYKSLELFTQLGDNGGMAINLGNIGDVYLAAANAIETSDQVPKILPKGTKQQFLANAIKHYEQSLEISKTIGQLENISIFSSGLSEAYQKSGNYAKALEAYKQHVVFEDSVHSDQNKLVMARLETEQEHALREKQTLINELQLAHKRRERILFAIALTMLVIVIVVITRKFIKQRKHNQMLARERKRHIDRIEEQKVVMGDIAYTHSHDVSGQVSTIVGLSNVFNVADYSDPDNKVVIDGIADTAKKLDIIVKDMIVKENLLNKSKKR